MEIKDGKKLFSVLIISDKLEPVFQSGDIVTISTDAEALATANTKYRYAKLRNGDEDIVTIEECERHNLLSLGVPLYISRHI